MSCNSTDRETDVTIKCLRELFLPPSAGSARTKRCLTVSEIPTAAKNWKPGKLDRIFKEFVTSTEEDSSMDCEIVASENSSQLMGLETSKNQSNSIIQTENAPASAGGNERSANHIRKTGDAKVKEESGRSKYLMQGNFNAPRKIASPPKTAQNFQRNGNDFDGPFAAKYADRDFSKPFQHPLFSVHEQQSSSGYGARKPLSGVEKRQGREKDFSDSKQEEVKPNTSFKTAHQQLLINDREKGIKRNLSASGTGASVHVSGLRKTARYEPPAKTPQTNSSKEAEPVSDNPEVEELMQNPLMKNIDPKMVETVLNEIFDAGSVDWDDIAGLQNVKKAIKEIIIYPIQRPDIFTGLRGPPKGILLFGPPGTGKTMIGKLIATQSKSSFFNISASSLTSKWIGDGEKMVRALFAVARVKQPAVIFIDEIDSILTQRNDTEHESSRRLKTEFLIQFDGCGSKSDDKILVIGVTNRPQELDDAARRRLAKRIYVPLPDCQGRKQLVQNLLSNQKNDLTEEDFDTIAEISEGYSGADMAQLCQDASYGPIRDAGVDIQIISPEEIRPLALRDFQVSIKHVKASVAEDDLVLYKDWDVKFGCHF